MLGMLQWWYVEGWRLYFVGLGKRLKSAADFFSLGLLVGNLFAPFRQISAEDYVGTVPLAQQFSNFLGKLLSRLIGAIVRIFLLIIGIVVIIVQAVGGIVLAVVWPLLPFMVVGCVVLAIMQVQIWI